MLLNGNIQWKFISSFGITTYYDLEILDVVTANEPMVHNYAPFLEARLRATSTITNIHVGFSYLLCLLYEYIKSFAWISKISTL